MATLIENTNKVVTTFDEIRQAIISKGVEVPSGTSVEEYATLIASIITGSSGIDTSDATATASDILSGETAYAKGEKVIGTMKDNGGVSATLLAGQSYTIPEGYHNGSGVAKAEGLASQTQGTATAEEILAGETAYINGEKVTGNMTNQGAKNASLNAGGSYTIPKGYHNGTGKVTANSLASQTDGTAAATDILSGATAYVDGVKITGTMTNQGSKTASLNAGESYTIPKGYHNGSGKITANSLAGQTDGTATAAQILSGQTAYVDGVKVTGTMANQGAKTASLNAGGSYTIPAGYHNGSGKITANSLKNQTVATATADDILLSKTAYVNGEEVRGTMANLGGMSKTLIAGERFVVQEGYHDGTGIINAQDLASQTEATAVAPDILKGETAWVNGGKVTGTMESKAAATYTPKASDQTINAGVYLGGNQTIKGDANLVAGNILSGKSIFGVSGTATADATATAEDILVGTTAYVNGEKIEGSMENKGFLDLTSKYKFVTNTMVPPTFYEAGYYEGVVLRGINIDLAEHTQATAKAWHILSGETAYVNGNQVTGTMPNHGNKECTLEVASIKVDGMTGYASDTILPGGYYSGITITPPMVDVADYTQATATASDIAEGKTAYVNGAMVTGEMVVSEETDVEFESYDSKTVSANTYNFSYEFTEDVGRALVLVYARRSGTGCNITPTFTLAEGTYSELVNNTLKLPSDATSGAVAGMRLYQVLNIKTGDILKIKTTDSGGVRSNMTILTY